MIEKSELKVGLFIWWKADRVYKYWDCPAIITYVSKKYFQVISFDDFKESPKLKMDDDPASWGDKSSRAEMRISSLGEVKVYLEQNLESKQKEITSKRNAIKDARAKLVGLKKDAKEYLNNIESFLAKSA